MTVIYTIGFTGKTAEQFFDLLNQTDAKYLLDIRVHNNSQLAGFTKKGNIEYFLRKLTNLQYHHAKILAPGEEIFKEYRASQDWELYSRAYVQQLDHTDAEHAPEMKFITEGSVLLCSEPTPEKCHRRLAAEYLVARCFAGVEIMHL